MTPGYLGKLLWPLVALDLLDDAASSCPPRADTTSFMVLREGDRGGFAGVRLHLSHACGVPPGGHVSPTRDGLPAKQLFESDDGVFRCMSLRLSDSESWHFIPPVSHPLVWIAVASGGLLIDECEIEREIALFAAGDGPIEAQAVGPVEAIVGLTAMRPRQGHIDTEANLSAA